MEQRRSTKVISSGDFAGNATYTEIVPEGQEWRILYGLGHIDTDATVANRYFRPSIQTSAGTKMVCLCAGAAATANVIYQYSYLPGIYRETAFVNDVLQCPLPADGWMKSGDKFYVEITNGVAGDVASMDYVVEVR